MTNLSDEEILRRIQRGERTLYVELFDRYYGRVERYAYHQREEKADSLASDTFLWAYQNVADCHLGKMSYLSYLLKVCRRLILMERERSPRSETDRSHSEQRMENGGGSLRSALRCLSDDDREVIYLSFQPDLSRQEVMAVLDEPSLNALTTRLNQAMRRLQALMTRQLPVGVS